MERLEIIPGAGDSINRDSEAEISPRPSIGLARAFITQNTNQAAIMQTKTSLEYIIHNKEEQEP